MSDDAKPASETARETAANVQALLDSLTASVREAHGRGTDTQPSRPQPQRDRGRER